MFVLWLDVFKGWTNCTVHAGAEVLNKTQTTMKALIRDVCRHKRQLISKNPLDLTVVRSHGMMTPLRKCIMESLLSQLLFVRFWKATFSFFLLSFNLCLQQLGSFGNWFLNAKDAKKYMDHETCTTNICCVLYKCLLLYIYIYVRITYIYIRNLVYTVYIEVSDRSWIYICWHTNLVQPFIALFIVCHESSHEIQPSCTPFSKLRPGCPRSGWNTLFVLESLQKIAPFLKMRARVIPDHTKGHKSMIYHVLQLLTIWCLICQGSTS